MKIPGSLHQVFVRSNDKAVEKTSAVETASPSEQALSEKAHALGEEAHKKFAHEIALSKERYRILIGGVTVAPEKRLALEGITAENLSEMTDDEYLAALQTEATKYQTEASCFLTQMWKILDPARPDPATNPSFTEDEAKSTLENYVSLLNDSIRTRNMFQNYIQSENVWNYLVNRFGEEGAKAVRDRTQKDIDVFDGLISNTLTSLNILYSLKSGSLVSQKDGVWSLTATDVQYSGGSGTYKFSIGDDGSIVSEPRQAL